MRTIRFVIILGLLLLAVTPAITQAETAGDEPVAYAVLFYSPTCPHCHKVIDEDLPVFNQEFGDQLTILFVDVSTQGGSMLFSATCDALDTDNRCGGVPMLAVGDTLLFGSVEIPTYLPGIVRDGLATGGIGLPPVPMLLDAYAASQPEATTAESGPAASADAAEAGISTMTTDETIWGKLSADPVANALAVVILVGLLGSVLIVSTYGSNQRTSQQWRTWGTRLGIVIGLVLAVSLVSVGGDDTLARVGAIGVLVMLGVAAYLLVTNTYRAWAVPIVAVAGLLVAGYMYHIESTGSDAVCGVIGNCNAVQQSEYAAVFGIHISLIGIIGYIAILIAWVAGRMVRSSTLHDYAYMGLLGLTLIGTLFSAYLTFLEPFVIGATCAWCLTSAVIMVLLLWLSVDEGWQAWLQVASTPGPSADE